MESLIEVQRSLHEERERSLDLIVKEFLAEKRNQRERVNSDQRSRELIERFSKSTDQLCEIYKDENGERAREIQSLGGPNEFAEFYSRLKVMKEAHRRNPNEEAMSLTIEFDKKLTYIQNPERIEREMVRFSDEEGYGKFLDMHLLFDQYINLKDIKKIDYINYLEKFDQLYEISRETTKKTGAYREYVNSLLEYITDFLKRAKPLTNTQGIIQRADQEFESKWAEGSIPGWSKDKSAGALANTGVPLDLSEIDSVEQLETIGADRLKSALIAAGLKCGGTPKQRAERLFSTKTLSGAELEKLKKPANSAEAQKEERRTYNLAKLEHQLYKIVELIGEERHATRENVERKQARVFDDEEEAEDEVEDNLEEEVVEDDVPYNPKNLPLGWDNKPIPVWLYLLHGLNISYSCEICGNQAYKGLKTFQRHFTEWRHSHGMRCLGIPNTPHFANITKINDALELWRKMCADKETSKWVPELDEQFEDSKGNVLTRRTFEDLKRQGLL